MEMEVNQNFLHETLSIDGQDISLEDIDLMDIPAKQPEREAPAMQSRQPRSQPATQKRRRYPKTTTQRKSVYTPGAEMVEAVLNHHFVICLCL